MWQNSGKLLILMTVTIKAKKSKTQKPRPQAKQHLLPLIAATKLLRLFLHHFETQLSTTSVTSSPCEYEININVTWICYSCCYRQLINRLWPIRINGLINYPCNTSIQAARIIPFVETEAALVPVRWYLDTKATRNQKRYHRAFSVNSHFCAFKLQAIWI